MANVTKELRVGQKVSVTELETSGCRLAVVDGDASALTITEAAPDFLVLADAAGDVTMRLPTYLVRSVTFPESAAPESGIAVPVIETAAAPAIMPETTPEPTIMSETTPEPTIMPVTTPEPVIAVVDAA